MKKYFIGVSIVSFIAAFFYAAIWVSDSLSLSFKLSMTGVVILFHVITSIMAVAAIGDISGEF